jgi:hypothetical protein
MLPNILKGKPSFVKRAADKIPRRRLHLFAPAEYHGMSGESLNKIWRYELCAATMVWVLATTTGGGSSS